MKIADDVKLDFDDVLIVPQRSKADSRKKIDLVRNFKFYHSPRIWSGVPIMVSNMDSIAGFKMAKEMTKHKIITCLHKYLNEDKIIEFLRENGTDYNWVSIGYSFLDIEKIIRISARLGKSPNLCIDVPNGYMDTFVKFCGEVRKRFPESIIMAGNVTTANMTQELLIHGGVDIVKTQIGPGSVCATRMMAGVGYGTLSCVLECSHVAHGLKSEDKKLGLICSDGGCKTPGDVCKALCAGADFVMMGGIFGGTEQCEGEWEYETEYKNVSKKLAWFDEDSTEDDPMWTPTGKTRKKNLIFYGMSTHHSQNRNGEGKKDYRASEGIIKKIPYRGDVSVVFQELLGGIRSCCAYIGATKIKEMSKCAEFCRVTKIHNNHGSDIVFGS